MSTRIWPVVKQVLIGMYIFGVLFLAGMIKNAESTLHGYELRYVFLLLLLVIVKDVSHVTQKIDQQNINNLYDFLPDSTTISSPLPIFHVKPVILLHKNARF